MKSFPSTLNEAQNMYGSTKSQLYETTFDIDRIKNGALNLNKSIPVVQEMLKQTNINISNYQAYPKLLGLNNPKEISNGNSKADQLNKERESALIDAKLEGYVGYNEDGTIIEGSKIDAYNKIDKAYKKQLQADSLDQPVYYENPLQLPADIIALAKDYDWVYKYRVKGLASVGEKSGASLKVAITNTAISPSMFNPMYGVSVLGIIRNTPLLNDVDDTELDPKTSDCSIRTLCALSKNANSPLGQARYKYADFMYCKDLGKVSNNHLITLRKFAHPIGDHIFEMTSPKYVQAAGDYSFQAEGDIGRLITWFGTDDNKLEDICKYSYHATWVEKDAQIQQEDSTAEDQTTGFVGMISNSINPVYNKAVAAGQAGTHSIWGWLGSHIHEKTLQGIGKNNGLLRNYDNNKVYTPMNTIQSTHLYEGKLEFSQEFTLNFSYQLRAYDNINPRSALLDLVGNVLEVTYRRGKFWGGSRKIIGPEQDLAPFDKTSNFIDKSFDKLGGFFTSIMNGGVNWNNLLGNIGSFWSDGVGEVMNSTKGKVDDIANQVGGYIKNIATSSGVAEAAKGYLKNALGRPTMYMWHSLLSGDAVGLWHVTIGNPRNPIMVMGNLILTNSTVTHSGPLGIDDFPTEMKVSITLKHARPRDVTEIGRMYTKGASAIYHTLAHHDIKDFITPGGGKKSSNTQLTKEQKDLQKTNKEIGNTSSGASAEMSKSASAAYKQDVTTYASNNYKYSIYPDLDQGVSNPFLESDEHVHILRTNNFSDTMFSMSIQEAA